MIGILLTNTGTPDEPTAPAVRRYLREFLSDKRIVHISHLIWLPILYGIILPFRSPKSAALYQKIWTPQGSPMRVYMEELSLKLETALNEKSPNAYCVAIGMNYGNPSIAASLKQLRLNGAKQIIVLPIFPQFSHTSTSSSFDRVDRANIPSKNLDASATSITKINDYHNHPAYIAAVAESANTYWQQHGRGDHLLISFHGIPERFAAEGDPYPTQCARTAELLAEKLQLPSDKWTLCYQSQFGYDKWLKPSTQALFTELPAKGIKSLDIICPGFAVDCLETLEEIAKAGKESFIESGGQKLNYIPALNAQGNISTLTALIQSQT